MAHLKEKLERAKWEYKDSYALMEIYGRNDERLLYDPRVDEVYGVYGNKVELHKPTELELEKLCER